MEEQAKQSLAFYLAYMRDVLGYGYEDMENRNAEIAMFISQEMDENPIPRRWRENNWHEAYAPLPIDQIDIGRYIDTAMTVVFRERHPMVPVGRNGGGSKLNAYVDAIRREKGDEDAANTRRDIEDIWKRAKYVLEQPGNENRAYGLAVGRVQSGKTQSYIGLILQAIDENWNTIILLTSKNNLLARQTYDRIQQTFNDIGLGVNPLSIPVDRGGLRWQTEGIWSPNQINFGIALKEHHQIDWIKQWLTRHQNCRPQMRMLIIDDESDNATPDGRIVGGIRFHDDEEVRSMANELEQYREQGAQQVAEWILSLIGEDFSLTEEEADVLATFSNQTSTRGLRDALASNDGVLRLIRLKDANGEFIEMSGWHLFNLVMRFFNRNKPRNVQTLVYGKSLLAFIQYIAKLRPEHSIINAAMRVIAGRSCDRAGMPLNDVEPYTYGQMFYIGYTATPYANMLNENPMRDPLAPDFIKPLSTSRKYFGLERIFGSRPMNIVQEISCRGDNNEGIILENIDTIVENEIDFSGLIVRVENSEEHSVQSIEWKSLKDAIAWLFCSAAARRIYRMSMDGTARAKRSNRWTTMIFNVSHEQVWQNKLSNWVRRYLAERINPDSRQHFVEECLSVWEKHTATFTASAFSETCGNDYPGTPKAYPCDTEFREALIWFIDHWDRGNVRVVEINSSPEGHDGSDEYYDDGLMPGSDVAWILCGGNVISRGLTLEGLTTSYFNRVKDGTSVDTITQMGRWFGYRGGYELLPRIWMTYDAQCEMKNICEIENLMHSQLHKLFDATYVEYDEDGNLICERPLSPVLDKGRYGLIAYFGRRLSGRDSAMQLEPPPGLGSIRGTLDEFSAEPQLQQNAIASIRSLTTALTTTYANRQTSHMNDPDYDKTFHRFAHWSGINGEEITRLIESIQNLYPAQSDSHRRAVALKGEIENSNCVWDIVFGKPATNVPVTDIGLDYVVNAHNDRPEVRADGSLAFRRRHTTATGFFTGIKTPIINLAECDIVERHYGHGWIPEVVNDLADQGVNIKEELTAVRADPWRRNLNPIIRNHFNFAARYQYVSDEYLHAVFTVYQSKILRSANPILLIDFVKPTGEEYNNLGFLPVLSYYWPGRKSIDYQIAVAGGSTTSVGERAILGGNVSRIVEIIRKCIDDRHLITEAALRLQVIQQYRESDINENDYQMALSRFTALNSGTARERTVLSHDELIYAPEEVFSCELDLKRNAELGCYVDKVNAKLIDIAVRWPPESGMTQIDYIRFIKQEFPGVFFGDALRNRLWPEYRDRRPRNNGAGYEERWDVVDEINRMGANPDNEGVYAEPSEDPDLQSHIGSLGLM